MFCVATKSGSQLVNILHLQNVYGSSVALSRERRFEKMRWCGGNERTPLFAFLGAAVLFAFRENPRRPPWSFLENGARLVGRKMKTRQAASWEVTALFLRDTTKIFREKK